MAFNFLKSLDADDIFISYSRADGGSYVKGIVAALSKEGFSCFSDKFGTDANRLPPETLFRKVRSAKTLVLLGTPKALDKPQHIAPEVIKFAEANGTARIVPVSFDQGMEMVDWSTTPWYAQVEGKAREREDLSALTTGEPSPAIVANIATASDYMKGKDRLRKYRNRALAGFLALLVAGFLAGGFALYGFWQARNSRLAAENAQKQAQDTIAKADEDVKKARNQADIDIKSAKDVANVEIQKAQDDARKKITEADALAKAADVKRVTAERLRRTALAEANRQQTIGSARSLASRAQNMLRQRPREVTRSLSLAIDAMKKSSTTGVHVVEADTALREGLALLPRIGSRIKYAHSVSALSPDGHYYAVSTGQKLRIFEAGSDTPPREVDCECATVALSSKPLRAATVTERGVEMIDVDEGARHHLIPFAEGVSAEMIALSPDGRYLATVGFGGESEGRFSKLWIVNTATGKAVKTFDFDPEAPATEEGSDNPKKKGTEQLAKDIAAMVIKDIAFGRNGSLAIGGKINTETGGTVGGRVIMWPVSEANLADDSFSNGEVIRQEFEVTAVSPGADDTYFATDLGVWKRFSGRSTYESVARLPSFPEEAGSQIERLAFSSNSEVEGLAVVRYVSGLVDDPTPQEQHIWELWDGIAQSEVSKVFHEEAIAHVGFKPGGQFVSTISSRPITEKPVRVFQTNNGAELVGGGIAPGSDDGEAIYVSPAAAYLITSGKEAIQVWDAWERKKTSVQFSQALEKVEAAAVGAGGNALALTGPGIGGGQTIVVYRKKDDSYAEWKRLPQNNMIETMVLSADGERLAVLYRYDTNFARVFDVSTGKDVMTDKLEHLNDVKLIMLSPSGRYLATVERIDESGKSEQPNRAQILDLNKGVMVNLLDDTLIECASFSQNDRYLGLGSGEGIVHVFETGRPEDEIARLQHTGKITAIAFSDNDKYVATASSDPHPYGLSEEESYPLRVWLLQPDDLITEASERLALLSQPRQ